ncbi:MAG: N-acetylmuramoyl-L-alanine amidase [Lachnospiraceae bacterium]|nr:N-acetylmuramoyl-L-alanine amidase [Lachnospiraceae bacterium]
MKGKLLKLFGLVFLCVISAGCFSNKVQAQNITIMLDPGHGGTNFGGQVPGYDEKDLTLVLANCVKQELERFDGITVLMTRYDDEEVSLDDRPKRAIDAGADFFISLHFNKAVPNNLYGAEVWIPSSGEHYVKGFALGDLVLNELCDSFGIYRRGIKTKVKEGLTEYYGVLRAAEELNISSILIEHCHIDNPEDDSYWRTPQALAMLGKLDATAIAKYFGLHSKDGLVDYSGYPKAQVPIPASHVIQDLTPPERVSVEFVQKKGQSSVFNLTAIDSGSPILYYSISTDGGSTWSAYKRFQGKGLKGNTLPITIDGSVANLKVRVYNTYDLCSEASYAAG